MWLSCDYHVTVMWLSCPGTQVYCILLPVESLSVYDIGHCKAIGSNVGSRQVVYTIAVHASVLYPSSFALVSCEDTLYLVSVNVFLFSFPSFLPFVSPPLPPSSFIVFLLQITMVTEMNTVGLYKLWCSIWNVYFLFDETITVLSATNQAAWGYGAVYISYIPQMKQHEPKGWMLFCLVDVP